MRERWSRLDGHAARRTSPLSDGSATDDGVPAGANATASRGGWSAVRRRVPFALGIALRTATLPDPGTYVLRLRATDSVLVGRRRGRGRRPAGTAAGEPPRSRSRPPPTAIPAHPGRLEYRRSAESGTLASWRLEHRLAGEPTWTRFAGSDHAGERRAARDVRPDAAAQRPLRGPADRHRHSPAATRRASSARRRRRPRRSATSRSRSWTWKCRWAGLPIGHAHLRQPRQAAGRLRLRLAAGLSTSASARTARRAWAGRAQVRRRSFPTYCLPAARPHVVTVTLPDGRCTSSRWCCRPAASLLPAPRRHVSSRATPGHRSARSAPVDRRASVVGRLAGPGGALRRLSTSRCTTRRCTATPQPDGRSLLVHQTGGLRELEGPQRQHPHRRPGRHHALLGQGRRFARDPQGRITTHHRPRRQPHDLRLRPNGDLVLPHRPRESDTPRFTYHLVPAPPARDQGPAGPHRPSATSTTTTAGSRATPTPSARRSRTAHDLDARQEVVTTAPAPIRVLEYDERGNVVEETQPDGKVVVRTFDARNNRLTETCRTTRARRLRRSHGLHLRRRRQRDSR